MEEDRHVVLEFRIKGRSEHDGAQQQDREHRRPIARVDEAVVEITRRAALAEHQAVAEQWPLATPWTLATESSACR
jgi:hypothetical protein